MDLRICLEILPTRLNREPAPDDLAFSVTPSQQHQVREYWPVFHRLRLSASP